MSVAEAFGDVASSIAQMDPDKISALKAPASMSIRVEELVNRKKDGIITPEETTELECFLALDLFISLTKARARVLLATSMRRTISAKNRRFIAQRADHRCEYCRIHEDDLFLAFEIDHIISVKHGGGNELGNLAYACAHFNHHKGSDLTTFLDSYDDIVDLQQYTGQISKQPVEVAHCNSRKGKDSLALNASVDDCTRLQYIQKQPV